MFSVLPTLKMFWIIFVMSVVEINLKNKFFAKYNSSSKHLMSIWKLNFSSQKYWKTKQTSVQLVI